jgi:hypothetical protein
VAYLGPRNDTAGLLGITCPAAIPRELAPPLVERLLHGIHATSLSCHPANPAWRLCVRLGFEPLPGARTMLRMKAA